ncbi:protein of unknown function [Taphrina deformans PYCC 5710]|uniref:Pal1 cell morphology protein n=1 Tax=Taphrina deformans (strain PYCC 5710 / ATCC 11124 / CBS 356.35 / IMI 108563 / JCM 9778 / NBRC 8474) TaxID=1097556 RepID=R4XE69_TAPDE|nr:protein of unknown function [Taphrina deformans PYCC 5710]|eukprot:CCG84100.1 protein of unknown function [Taphrina deformans PYCC 5710]
MPETTSSTSGSKLPPSGTGRSDRPSSSRRAGDNGDRSRDVAPALRSSQKVTKREKLPETESRATRSHRPRSNSDTSIASLKKERTNRERKRQPTTISATSKDKSESSTKSRKNLDKIDRLDVTGFMTTGGFHHDGPFDACNPSRNKNSKRAPVLAFAKDSTAMTLSAGPPTQPVYFGDHLNNAESFADYGSASRAARPGVGIRAASFDPASTIDPIHGHESVGLGTTTFLEGAPASRSAMLARTVSDNGGKDEFRPRATSDYASGSSLGRKKSVLQKIRGAYKDRATESRALSASPPQSPHRSQIGTQSTEESSRMLQEVHGSKPISSIAIQLTDEEPSTSENTTSSYNSSKLSPLYRPASNGGTTGNGSGANGLIKRVRSLRVGGKKRSE